MQHVKGTHFDLDWSCVIPLWLACAIWAAVLMHQRGHPTWKGLLVGLALGPMGVLWALTMPRAPANWSPWQTETVLCRFCKRRVSRYAPVCPHCGRQRPAVPLGE
jgi:hypothetical protein